MITRFSVQNYKALRDVSLSLTPLHALIGPNDSGKTSILNALFAFCRSADFPLPQAFAGSWDGRELVWHGAPDSVVGFIADLSVERNEMRYSLKCRFPNRGRAVKVDHERMQATEILEGRHQDHQDTQVHSVCTGNAQVEDKLKAACGFVYQAISGVHYHRWIARHLALPTAPDSSRRFRLNPDGFGLPLFLDDILGFDRELFGRLERKFCNIFPEITSIKLMPQMAFRSPVDSLEQVTKLDQADGKGLFFQFRGSQQLVPAAQASDGVLLVLGYLAILFSPQPPRLILIEEPENGIHPKRLERVMEILRDLIHQQSHTQVVFTTHSPYAVDLLKPEEVTLCTKGKDGAVQLTRLADSKSVAEQLSVFTLGEIWTAEGDEDLAREPSVAPST
jgi:predicted ATPase